MPDTFVPKGTPTIFQSSNPVGRRAFMPDTFVPKGTPTIFNLSIF